MALFVIPHFQARYGGNTPPDQNRGVFALSGPGTIDEIRVPRGMDVDMASDGSVKVSRYLVAGAFPPDEDHVFDYAGDFHQSGLEAAGSSHTVYIEAITATELCAEVRDRRQPRMRELRHFLTGGSGGAPPTPHAATHAKDGSDPLAIGTQPVVGTPGQVLIIGPDNCPVPVDKVPAAASPLADGDSVDSTKIVVATADGCLVAVEPAEDLKDVNITRLFGVAPDAPAGAEYQHGLAVFKDDDKLCVAKAPPAKPTGTELTTGPIPAYPANTSHHFIHYTGPAGALPLPTAPAVDFCLLSVKNANDTAGKVTVTGGADANTPALPDDGSLTFYSFDGSWFLY